MKNYGLPYQGSKNRIIGWLMSALPGADTFVDLFAGGCAVSHAAMVSGRYRQVITTDITDSALVFQDAIRGKFHNERRWISREDFFSLKDHDAYARLCFSFGNDQRSYMYSQQLEPYKRACHEAVVFDRWEMMKQLCPEVYAYVKDDVSRCGQPDTNNYIRVRRTCFQNSVVEALQRNGDDRILQSNPLYASCHFKKNKAKSTSHIRDLECNPNIERLERLQQLETLQSLQSLESLERLQSLERLGGVFVEQSLCASRKLTIARWIFLPAVLSIATHLIRIRRNTYPPLILTLFMVGVWIIRIQSLSVSTTCPKALHLLRLLASATL